MYAWARLAPCHGASEEWWGSLHCEEERLALWWSRPPGRRCPQVGGHHLVPLLPHPAGVPRRENVGTVCGSVPWLCPHTGNETWGSSLTSSILSFLFCAVEAVTAPLSKEWGIPQVHHLA